MKIHPSLRLFFLSLILSAAVARAASDSGNLFNSNEFQFSVFLQTGNGNVDVQPQTHTNYTTTTTTTHTTVAAPSVPTPSPTPIPELAHKAAGKPGGRTIDPVVTKTKTTKHVASTHRTEHNVFGGGVKFSYFFTRYFGASLEGDFLGGNPYDTAAVGELIFRYPFEFGATRTGSGYAKDGKDEKSVVTGPTWGIAPYLLVGGGGQWDGRGVGVGTVGGGLEFRFHKHWGIFAEGRWVVHDSRQNYAAESIGVDYAF